MNRSFRIIIIISLVALFLGAGGFVMWAENAAPARAAALAALQSDSKVTVANDKWITFTPASRQPITGFIFYPGGRVDYRAYAPILRMIAERGYLVALVPVRLNLAFFDLNAAAPVIAAHPEIQYWAVGGHSLGGVAAATFAETHAEIQGVVYWAAYPSSETLKDKGLKTLSIYGTKDGLATGDKLEKNKALMPVDTIYVPIEGGNHAQFGDYGPQDGDNPATISAESQWQQAADATASLLASLSTLAVIKNCGHVPHEECPADFMSAVEMFLK